jgi:hypothetical protein
VSIGTLTYSGTGLDCFSLNDSGTETLALDESDGTWSVAGETDQFEIHDSVTNQYGVSGSESANYAGTFTEVDTGTYGGSNWYSIDDNGEDSLVGTATESSDSYTLSDGDHFSETEGGHYSGTIRSSNWYYGILESIGSDSGNTATEEDYTLVAHGTDSFGPDGDDESTMSFDADGTYTSSTEASWSFLTLNAGNDASLTDVHGAFNEYDSATDATSGWSTVSDGTTVLSYHEYLSTFFSETVSDTYGPTVGGTDTFGELTIQSTCGSTTDITGNNWSGFTTITHSSNYSSESSLTGGWEWSDTDEFEIVGGIPESATSGSLLVEFQDEQDGAGKLLADYSSGSIFLYDSYGGYWLDAGYCYVPHSVPAYLSGLAPDVGLAPSGWPVTAPSSNAAFGFVPSTNAATAHGLPTEKASALDNLALNDGPTDGVSQTATAPPTSVLVTLAAAGRNPTDILIPTQAGTEGSGGDDDDEDDDVAGGGSATSAGTFQATDDEEDDGSHEVDEPLNIDQARALIAMGSDPEWVIRTFNEGVSAKEVFAADAATWNTSAEPRPQPFTLNVRTTDQVIMELAEKAEPVLRPFILRGGAVLNMLGDVGGVYVGVAIATSEASVPVIVGGALLAVCSADHFGANAATLYTGEPQPSAMQITVLASAHGLGASDQDAANLAGLGTVFLRSAQAYNGAMIFPTEPPAGSVRIITYESFRAEAESLVASRAGRTRVLVMEDPGVLGTINPAKDELMFVQTELSSSRIDSVSPFNQSLSDAGGQPIRVVVTQSGQKYIMQGSHRTVGAREQGLQSIRVMLYTPEQWEVLTEAPFSVRATNNPLILP